MVLKTYKATPDCGGSQRLLCFIFVTRLKLTWKMAHIVFASSWPWFMKSSRCLWSKTWSKKKWVKYIYHGCGVVGSNRYAYCIFRTEHWVWASVSIKVWPRDLASWLESVMMTRLSATFYISQAETGLLPFQSGLSVLTVLRSGGLTWLFWLPRQKFCRNWWASLISSFILTSSLASNGICSRSRTT